MLAGICQSMADGGQDPGARRASAKAYPGKTDILEYQATGPASQDDAQGRGSVRVLHGPVDLSRVAELIDRTFGVRYHPASVWKVLRGEGWSCQNRNAKLGARREGHREVADGALAPI